MAAVTPVVKLVLPQQTAGNDPNALEFDDATHGKFNTGKFAVGGPVEVDISADVQSIQTRRGRSSTLDQPEAGTCTLELRNDRANKGDYDPLNASGPYYPWLAGSGIKVTVHSNPVFTGNISGFALSEDIPHFSVARIEAQDAVAKLGDHQTNIGLLGPNNEGDWDAIMHHAVLLCDPDAVWDSDGFQLTGTQFGDHLGDTISVRDFLARMERSEGGILAVAADGTWRWREREGLYSDASAATLSDQAADALKYSQIERGAVFDRIVNSVSVSMDTFPDERPTGRSDTRSADVFGYRALEFAAHVPGGTGTSYADEIAQLIISDYANPKTSIVAVTLPTARFSTGNQDTILGLDIGDIVTVKRTAPGVSASTVAHVIVGVESSMAPKHHETTFRLQPRPTETWSTL